MRSAQRFFIANDNRLLPSGVSPPRFLAFNADGRDVAMLVFLAVRGEFAPSNAAMARLSLSLSCFKSATILCRSKIHSFPLIRQLNDSDGVNDDEAGQRSFRSRQHVEARRSSRSNSRRASVGARDLGEPMAEGHRRTVVVGGHTIVLFNSRGRPFVVDNRCPQMASRSVGRT